MLYRFENFALDTDRRELRRDAVLLSLEPQVFDLLLFLIRNRDRLVSKGDLLASVWGGRIVSESTLTSRINALRRVIGDNGQDQRLIRTAIGRGVRFVGAVQEHRIIDDAVAASVPPRLSLVVLPFANFSNEPELEHFADGLTDDLTTDLSQIPESFVIARNSAFAYKGKSIDVTHIGRELGVRYVIEGSVRSVGDRVRVNVQLTDAGSGAHLWADRFDADHHESAEKQNEAIGRLTRILNIKLLEAASRCAEQDSALDSNPQDLLLHAWDMINRVTTATALQEVLRVFERVLKLQPGSVSAKIGIGYALAVNINNYWSTAVRDDIARAEPLLLEAIEQEPNNALARTALGLLRRLQNRLEESRVELERAIELAPNFAPTFWHLGSTLSSLGQPDAAIPKIERGLRLCPPGAVVPGAYGALSAAHLLLGHADEAIEFARRGCAGNPRLYFPHLFLAAALGLKGDIDGARIALAEAIKVRPEFSSFDAFTGLHQIGDCAA